MLKQCISIILQNSVLVLTIWECGGCKAVFYSLPITQCCSHSDGVLSGLLQTSQVVHCLISTEVFRVSETLSVVSVGVGDGVGRHSLKGR